MCVYIGYTVIILLEGTTILEYVRKRFIREIYLGKGDKVRHVESGFRPNISWFDIIRNPKEIQDRANRFFFLYSTSSHYQILIPPYHTGTSAMHQPTFLPPWP